MLVSCTINYTNKNGFVDNFLMAKEIDLHLKIFFEYVFNMFYMSMKSQLTVNVKIHSDTLSITVYDTTPSDLRTLVIFSCVICNIMIF